MIPDLRQHFNANFTQQKYKEFLRQLDALCGTHIKFRVSETPCFLPQTLLETMARYGQELVEQLLGNPAYLKASDATVPTAYNVPNEDKTPLFVSVDFGLVRNSQGAIEPKLVELQAFPTLYAYQPALAGFYKEFFGLREDLRVFLGGLDEKSYAALLRHAVLGKHDAENVVLLEIDPLEQKTLPDFVVTERMCGIPAVNITEVVKQGRKLCYRREGKLIPIHRIYNRAIVDEIVRKGVKPAFDYRDELDVEWAGHPNWYFRISKFSIPWLKHACVPKTWFLHELKEIPSDREGLILKPLYSFAGAGITFAPSDEDFAKIPQSERHNYILQERMSFAPVIETPHGATQAEVRIMYIWPEDERMIPVLPLVRMGRGKMMGVDHNRNLEWVGGSAALYPAGS